ncbi:MAG: hypothetical protein ACM3KM_02660 [Acidobacteriaceae bacterium]
MKKPFELYILVFLMIFMGVMALWGGIGLVSKPDGSYFKIPLSDLGNTPFQNYLIPGLFLGTSLGILPFLLVYALFVRPRSIIFKKLNLYRDMAWPWTWAVYYGVLQILWITIEIMWVGYHSIVQSIVVVWGVATIVVALLPRIRNYYREVPEHNEQLRGKLIQ